MLVQMSWVDLGVQPCRRSADSWGIVIAMYYREHAPLHFHAKYGPQRAQFSIADLRIMEGRLPPRVVSLVLEWAFQHREELLENWNLAERKEDLRKIRPLV